MPNNSCNIKKSSSDNCTNENISKVQRYISVVVPITEYHGDLSAFYMYYESKFKTLPGGFEFIFVVNSRFTEALIELKKLKKDHSEIKIIKFARNFGEAVALSAGFKEASGEFVLTLYPYIQVESAGIDKVLDKLKDGNDLVITRRNPRVDSRLNRIQTFLFNWLLRKFVDISFHDISCGLRGMRSKVAKEINLYGEFYLFIPILAYMQGFKVTEIDVRQSKEEAGIRLHSPGTYIRRLLDILNVFFLFKFTQRPLRFFGIIGAMFFSSGLLINIHLTIQRISEHIALANRPLLLLGVLLMVLGIQVAAIGLLGEIIIYTHAREIQNYQIDEILD